MIYLNINIPSASALFAVFFFFFFPFPSASRACFVCVSAPSRAAVGIVLCARGERVRAQPALPFHVRARLASGDKTGKHDPHCCADNESQSQRPMFLTVGGAKWWWSGKKKTKKKTFIL